ncbi:MAG: hypothetical protein M3121_04255 [Chloroflexota bacterium]|nr:hypothetical protein [Chloroflexota bacterium]
MPPAPIGQVQLSPEAVIAGVRRQLDDDWTRGRCPSCSQQERDRVAVETVHELWPTSRIKAFLPVLALRQARERLQTAGCAQS